MAMTKDYDPRRDGPKTPVGNKKTPPFGPPSSRPVPRPPMPGKPTKPMPSKPSRPMPGKPVPRPPMPGKPNTPIKPSRPGKPMPAGIIGGWGAATPGGFNAQSFIESRRGFMQNPGSEAQAREQANIARQQAIMAALSKPAKGSNTSAPIAQSKVK